MSEFDRAREIIGKLARLIWLITLTLLLTSGAVKCDGKKLTIMVYMCGSNLESLYGSASADLLEMAGAGVNENEVSLLVMIGGSSHWAGGYDSGDTAILEIGSRGQRIISREARSNMGRKETLTGFLRFGMDQRPAEKYALIIWDHGGGPLEGVCWDELHGSDHLTLSEMVGAIAESPFGENGKKLSWIGFDACLMGSLEVADHLAPYAEYMIASQAEEPAGGWNYQFLNGIETDPDGAETGRRIVDTYFESLQGETRDLTMACVDLSKIRVIEAGMNTLYAGIAKTLTADTFSTLANLRLHATGFGKSKTPVQGTNGYDLVDLVSLTNCYEAYNPDAAGEIRNAVSRAVVYSRSNLEECYGLSVYHPFRNHEKYMESWNREYLDLSHCRGYASYVDAYGQIMTGEPLVRWNNVEYFGSMPTDTGVTVVCPLSSLQMKNMASARLIVLAKNEYDGADESYCRVYTSSDVYYYEKYVPPEEGAVLLAADYGGEVLQAAERTLLAPGTGCVSFRISEDGTYLIDLYPYGEDGIRPEKPIIGEYVRKPDTNELVLKAYAAYDEMTGTYSQRADIDLSDYQGVSFLNEYRNPGESAVGELRAFDSWPEDVHLDTQIDSSYSIEHDFVFTFSYGIYWNRLYVAFEITDTQGNMYMTPLAPIYDEEAGIYSVKRYLTKDAAEMQGYLSVSPDEVYFILSMENRSDVPETYRLDTAEINGIPLLDDTHGVLCINMNTHEQEPVGPGEKGVMFVSVSPEVLKEDNPEGIVKTIAGKVYVRRETGDLKTTLFSFTSSPMISYELSGEESGKFEEIDIRFPAAGTDLMSWKSYASVREGLNADMSKLYLNLKMTNNSKKNIHFGMILTSMNGIPLENEIAELSRNGNGAILEDRMKETGWEAAPENQVSLAPGETSMVTLTITRNEIKAIAPDPVLKECECILYMSEVVNGKRQFLNFFPMRLEMEIPLNIFYDGAIALPPLEPKTENAQEREARQKPIAAYEGFRLSLQRMYFTDQQALMLLYAENDGTQQVTCLLDHAEAGDRQAEIGKFFSDSITVRNNMIRTLNIDQEQWEENLCSREELAPGERKYYYVSIWNIGEEMPEKKEYSFDVLILPEDRQLASCAVQLKAAGDPESLNEEWEWLGTGDLQLQASEPALLTGTNDILEETVLCPAPGTLQAANLHIESGKTEKMSNAYYVIFRKISSQRSAAEMSLVQAPPDIDDQAILIPAAYGQMNISGDGKAADASFPAVQMLLQSGGKSLMIPSVYICKTEDGTIQLSSEMDRIGFMAGDTLLYQKITEIGVVFDPDRGDAFLNRKEGMENVSRDWADFAADVLYWLPETAGGKEILSFMSDYYDHEMEGRDFLMQMIPLSGQPMQIALEPLETPEECLVFFFWRHENGRSFSPLRPLTDYLR